MGREQARILWHEPAQVHDALHPGGLRRLCEVLDGHSVAAREVAVRARGGLHRVHEVVGHVAAVERALESAAGDEVALHGLHLGRRLESRRVASQRANGAPLAQQPLGQAAAHVSGRAGD